VLALRVKMIGQWMGGAERHLPDLCRKRGREITHGAWHICMIVIQGTLYHRINWNARLTARELSLACTSMQWRAQAIKGAVMGGDSQDNADNLKTVEGSRKMDSLVAPPLCRHSSTHAKKFEEKGRNWTPMLIILAFSARLVTPLPEYCSGIANWPSRSYLLATDICIWFWILHTCRDLANPEDTLNPGRGGSIRRHRRIQAIAPQLNFWIWATVIWNLEQSQK